MASISLMHGGHYRNDGALDDEEGGFFSRLGGSLHAIGNAMASGVGLSTYNSALQQQYNPLLRATNQGGAVEVGTKAFFGIAMAATAVAAAPMVVAGAKAGGTALIAGGKAGVTAASTVATDASLAMAATKVGGVASGLKVAAGTPAGQAAIGAVDDVLAEVSAGGARVANAVAGAIGEGTAAVVKSRRGRLGSPETQAQNSALADMLEADGWQVTHGAGRGKEEFIPGPGGGTKGSSYPDITATRDGEILRVNTVDTNAKGLPDKREAANLQRLGNQKPNDSLLWVPK